MSSRGARASVGSPGDREAGAAKDGLDAHANRRVVLHDNDGDGWVVVTEAPTVRLNGEWGIDIPGSRYRPAPT
jgi:hypothetical protein